jgi:hypothetical protein
MFLLYSSTFLLRDDKDLLIYAFYPSTEKQFLKWKYNFGEKPSGAHPKPLENDGARAMANYFQMDRSYFKAFNQVQDQGGSRGTTTVIVAYFEDWTP